MGRYTTFATAVGFGEETSAWATEAARSTWRRVESFTVERAAEHVGAASFQGDANAAAHFDEVITVREKCTGMIRMPLDYHGLGMLWKHAFGAVADAGTGPSSYTHTYTHARALPMGLTIEAGRGNALSEEIYGAKISKLTMEIVAKEQATMEVEIIAKTGQTRASSTSPSHVTPYRVVGHHLGAVGWNSLSITATRLRFGIDNHLAPVDECGSLYTAEPERTAPVSFEVEIEFFANSTIAEGVYNGHLAKTVSNCTFTLTHPTAGYTMAFTLHSAVVHECTTPLSGGGGGLMKTRALLRGYASGTDYGAALIITNAQSAGVA